MQLTPEQIQEVNNEIVNFLSDLKKQIENDGIESTGIDFTRIHREDLLSKSVDALASGDMLQCIIMHCMDNTFNDE